MKISKRIIITAALIAAVVLLGIKNNKKESRLHDKIIKEVTLVTDGKINPSNNEKLVLVSGKISYTSDDTLCFEELNPQINSFKIKRTVKDFISYEKDGKTHYEWKERTQEPMLYGSLLDSLYSSEIKINPNVGDFLLDDYGFDLVPTDESYEEAKEICGLKYNGLEYATHDDEDEPGDVSLNYNYFNVSKNNYLSVLAKQTGSTFAPYKIGKNNVYFVFPGKVDSINKLKDMFKLEIKKDKRGRIALIVIIAVFAALIIYDKTKRTKQNN
ncbi:MAG: hypothetical protein IKX23_08805 [Treponema sp.]|nr:hypothetical protein [Treponema sp.]